MEGSAVDYNSMENVLERVGPEEFRKIANELAPRKLNWRRVGFYTTYLVMLIFWMGVTPRFLHLDGVPAEAVYSVAIGNVLLIKHLWLSA
jgi:hypothetical protein